MLERTLKQAQPKAYFLAILSASLMVSVFACQLPPSTLRNKWEEGLHENAVWTAFDIVCPQYECTDRTGPSTTRLPDSSAEGIYERWCVEVLYENSKTGESGQAAVEVVLTDNTDDDNPANWKASETSYNADCSVFK
ncbi:MAG: hypothetical protein M3R47_09020 [Chloroflexota bacterium]|nr:hypothetical protein [Chloroflexota bacterium]